MAKAFEAELNKRPYIIYEVPTKYTLDIPEEDYKNFTPAKLKKLKASMFIFKVNMEPIKIFDGHTLNVQARLIRLVLNGKEIKIDDNEI